MPKRSPKIGCGWYARTLFSGLSKLFRDLLSIKISHSGDVRWWTHSYTPIEKECSMSKSVFVELSDALSAIA